MEPSPCSCRNRKWNFTRPVANVGTDFPSKWPIFWLYIGRREAQWKCCLMSLQSRDTNRIIHYWAQFNIVSIVREVTSYLFNRRKRNEKCWRNNHRHGFYSCWEHLMLPVIVRCLVRHISINQFDDDDDQDDDDVENACITKVYKLTEISLYSFCEVLKHKEHYCGLTIHSTTRLNPLNMVTLRQLFVHLNGRNRFWLRRKLRATKPL